MTKLTDNTNASAGPLKYEDVMELFARIAPQYRQHISLLDWCGGDEEKASLLAALLTVYDR